MQRHRSDAFKDAVFLLTVLALSIICSTQIDLFERLLDFLIIHDRYEIDEILIVFSIFSVFVSVYAFRRWRELRKAIVQQKEDKASLKSANIELKEKTAKLEFHNHQLEKLGGFAHFLQVCKSRDELYKFVGQAAPQLFKGTSGVLYITKDSRDQLSKTAEWGTIGLNPDFIYPDNCWGLRLGRQYIQGADRDKPHCQHISLQNDSSYHCLPLMAYGEIIGLLHIAVIGDESMQGVDLHAEIIEKVSPLFAEQISLVISNLALQDRLRDMAIYDTLTGLYNRRYLNEVMEREISRCRRARNQLGVIMIDLDHFKKFNDTYGHAAGDLVLGEVGKFLKSFFRVEDFCCRYGGEEILVLIPGISEDDLKNRCEELCGHIRELQILYNDQSLGKVTVSIGIAIFPENGEDSHELLKAADKALYASKKEGRNRFSFASMLRAEAWVDQSPFIGKRESRP